MDNIFPYITDEEDEDEAEEKLPLLKEIAYDIENNKALTKGGRFYFVEKDEALKIWIYKALHTERFRYPAYSSDYGIELEELIGSGQNRQILYSEIQRIIQEALEINPYITDIDEFEFDMKDGRIICSFRVTSIYDEFTYSYELEEESE